MGGAELGDMEKEAAKSGFTAQEVRDLEFVYKLFDVTGCGEIGGEDVRKALRLLAFKVNGKAVHQMLQDLAVSSTTKARSRNAADFEGFLEMVAKLQGSSFDQHEEIMDVSHVASYLDYTVDLLYRTEGLKTRLSFV